MYYYTDMIKVAISAPGLSMTAQLRDEALPSLISLIQEMRTEDAPIDALVSDQRSIDTEGGEGGARQDEVQLRPWLQEHGGAELLNRLGWSGNAEKILALAAWIEARGNGDSWRAGDVEQAFLNAREKPPGNFGRDAASAIRSGWIHPVTARTYQVSRTGWLKLEDAMKLK